MSTITRRVRARFRTVPNDHTVDVMIFDNGEALRTIAGNPDSDVVFVPFGMGRLREINSLPAAAPQRRRKTRTPRPQQYILVVTHTRPDTVAFEYTITGRNAADRIRTITGVFERNDAPLAPCSYTIVQIRPLTDINITITELPGNRILRNLRQNGT
jgi:hypothetical protein